MPVPRVSDDFNRADAGTLGANWTKLTNAAFFDLKVLTNQARGTASADNADVWTGSGWPGELDHWAETTVGSLGTNDGGPIIRSDGANVFYLIDLNSVAGGTVDFYKRVTSSYVLYGSTTATYTSDDVFRFSVVGTLTTAYKNGVQVQQVTDAAIDGVVVGGTKVGFLLFGTSFSFTAWAAGDFVRRFLLTR